MNIILASIMPRWNPLEIGSEFIDNLLQNICKKMYQGLWDTTNDIFSSMQDVLAAHITRSKDLVSQTPKQWNSSAFSFIQGVAEDAAIPIAACILTFIFCWQLISMVQESNQMHNIKPETMMLLLLKLGICLLVCSKSFQIVNGLFDVAAWGVKQIHYDFSPDSGSLSLNDLFPREQEVYTFGLVFGMLVNMMITLIAKLAAYIISVAIYIRVNIWYLELLIYASSAPIPFSTFINKEWGQMGMNYTRKMLAMVFEGFFMIVAFGLYSAMVTHVLTTSASDSYLMSMVTSIGCGFALLMILVKTGNISASIFNAH